MSFGKIKVEQVGANIALTIDTEKDEKGKRGTCYVLPLGKAITLAEDLIEVLTHYEKVQPIR